MTPFISYQTVLILLAVASLCLVFALVAPPRNPRTPLLVAGVLDVAALVVALVLALR